MQSGALPSGSKHVIDPIPDNLVREPIEYLFADHVRQRSLCGHLKSLADGVQDAAEFGFAEALVYLEVEHSNHMADEEENLFPMLRARFAADVALLELLEDLEREHARDTALGVQLANGLRNLAVNPQSDVTDSLRATIRSFVSGVMAHLSIEDEKILPLARSVLDDEDIEQMGRAMAIRRCIDYPV